MLTIRKISIIGKFDLTSFKAYTLDGQTGNTSLSGRPYSHTLQFESLKNTIISCGTFKNISKAMTLYHIDFSEFC